MAAIAAEPGSEDRQRHGQQDHPDHDDQHNLARGVREIDGPPEAIALGDERIGVVGIVIEDAREPVPVFIAVYRHARRTSDRGASLLP